MILKHEFQGHHLKIVFLHCQVRRIPITRIPKSPNLTHYLYQHSSEYHYNLMILIRIEEKKKTYGTSAASSNDTTNLSLKVIWKFKSTK